MPPPLPARPSLLPSIRPPFHTFLLLALLLPLTARAQTDGVLQVNDPLHRFLERQYAAGRLPGAFLSHQPLSAYAARAYLDTLARDVQTLSATDRHLLARYRGKQPGPTAEGLRTVLPGLYRNGQDLIAATGEGYALQVNPLAYFGYGRARLSARQDRDDPNVPVWQASWGARASGHIGRYLFFETRFEENQRRDAWPVQVDSFDTAPRLGFTKQTDGGTYDYMLATGLVGMRTKYVEARFGRDRNRWGHGPGSLLLSNYPVGYDHLQLRTTVWKLQYTNVFAGLTDRRAQVSDRVAIPRKYAAFHRLALNLPARLQLDLFQGIVFATDTLGARKGFDLSYANPIIFLRPQERDRGSPDNTVLGGGLSWVARPGLQVYTQLLLDEYRAANIGKQAFTNRYGVLAGLHLADVPLAGLSLRAEYARIRPYLYSHFNPLNAYTHYESILGHPAGPNAEDLAFFAHYQPTPRLALMLNVAYTRRGRNDDGLNYGSDPLLSYNTRASSRGVVLLQGIRQTYVLAEGTLGYELLPYLYLEAAFRAEHLDDAETGRDRYLAPFLLLRWSQPFQSTRY
jgi:hypothetical protein